ncbi:uracil-DNA glycosylase [Xylariaceae sp. FL0804]|nr:uracil-DNA glycosylase [Xylariaceae sp. FL0804]
MSSMKRKSDGPLTSGDANKKPKVNGSITSFFGPPKPAQAAPSKPAQAAPPKFDKAAWVATLTPEQKRLLALEIQTLDPSWLEHLKDDIVKPEFLKLKSFLESEVKSGAKVFPPREDVYSWSRHTPFHTVKCVIIGQDPYHNVNQAHGLCFSVRPPTPAPPSLKNMYTALARDYPGTFRPPPGKGGLLTPWAERGVLLLNTSLTVRAHQAGSHAGKGWERLTQRVVDLVAARHAGHGVVFMAWGNHAAQRVARVDASRHLVLRAPHPSPLSASRGFFDCGHFRKANDWIVSRYGPDAEIDWNLDPAGNSTRAAAAASASADDAAEPVVAVGEVDEAGAEKSTALDEEGENAAAAAEGEASATASNDGIGEGEDEK